MTTWKEIKSVEEWDELLDGSHTRPILLFKHSTACPISSDALKEFEAYIERHSYDNVLFTLVKVIESRPVSNKIADDLAVKHESPQILYIKDKHAIWNASHWDITRQSIHDALS